MPRMLKIALFTIVTSYLLAGICIIIAKLRLPPSDEAYHQSLRDTLSDPFVRLIGFGVASSFALIVFPFALFCLDRQRWLRQAVACATVVLIFIAVSTSVSLRLAVVGSPFVAICALLALRFIRGTSSNHRRTLLL